MKYWEYETGESERKKSYKSNSSRPNSMDGAKRLHENKGSWWIITYWPSPWILCVGKLKRSVKISKAVFAKPFSGWIAPAIVCMITERVRNPDCAVARDKKTNCDRNTKGYK